MSIKNRKDPFIDNDEPEFKVQSNGKFHVKVENENRVKEEKVEKRKKRKKVVKTPRKKSNWFNWTVPILLIITAFSVLILYPEPDHKFEYQPRIDVNKGTQSQRIFNAQALSQELISRYFNGTDEDIDIQTKALAETLDTLNKSNIESEINALNALKKNDLNTAKKLLISLSASQSDIQKSSQTWIKIGNIQNLSSSRQALQAYKKASNINPGNMLAYTKQSHIHKKLKQFTLAEEAINKIQTFANSEIADKALNIVNIGKSNLSKGKLVEAEDAFTEALGIYKGIDDEAGIGDASFNLANLYKDSDRLKKAEDLYKAALTNFTKQSNHQKMVDSRIAMGNIYQSLKLTNKAQYQYEAALEVSSNNNLEESSLVIYQGLGEVAETKGYIEKAEAFYLRAKGIDPDAIQDNQVADDLAEQAIINRQQGNFIEAEEQHKQAIKIYQQNNNITGTISQQVNLGFLYKAWDQIDLACLVWKDTLIISQRSNSNYIGRVEELINSTCF